MTNAATAPAGKKPRNLADLFLWWLILAVFAAAALLLPARRANAQETAGPLPAAAPSDQPPPSPRATAPAQIGGKPNLSGTWALNKDESDDPRQAMQQQSGNSGGHGGGGGGVHVGMGGGGMGGGGWGGGGQRGGGGSGGGGRRGAQSGSGDATNNLSQLTIEQTASSAKVIGDSGDVLALYSADDSSKETPSSAPVSGASSSSSGASSGSGSSASSSSNTSSGDSASASPAAQWQGTQLVAVTPGRREGSKTTRTYELSPDGKQLYVTTTMDNPRFKKPVTFRLVYDPAQSGG
jgi:hypothetical protein